jgi:hypothetical protein
MRNIKYIIEKLGFKHQWCLFHAFKNFNKTINKYITENNLCKEEKNKIKYEKLKLFGLFDNKSCKCAKNKSCEILNEIKGYSEIIQSIVFDSSIPYFKTFFNFYR